MKGNDLKQKHKRREARQDDAKIKTIGQLGRAFLEWVKLNRSQNTFKNYDGRLKPFIDRFGSRVIKSLVIAEIEDYLRVVNHWKDGTEKAPDTIRANIIALNQLEKFAMKREIVRKRFIGNHEMPIGRLRERLPTLEEVELIKGKSSAAFGLVYEALRRSGARPNELARATVENWDRSERVIVLVKHKTAKKTGRPRKIAVGEVLEKLILTSLGSRTTGPLFLTPKGHEWTTESLSSAFRRARNALKLDRAIVLYSARHEHATAMYKVAGMDGTKDALGHSRGVTDRYIKQDFETLCKNQDAISL